METKEIKAKNNEIVLKAVADFGVAAKGLIDALFEVVKNRGGEVKITKFIQIEWGGNAYSTIRKIFFKDGFLCVEHDGFFGEPIQTDIMQFEYNFLFLISLLNYAADC